MVSIDYCILTMEIMEIYHKSLGKDDDKKEQEYQKYIYYASQGYQYYGESGQDTNTKLF